MLWSRHLKYEYFGLLSSSIEYLRFGLLVLGINVYKGLRRIWETVAV